MAGSFILDMKPTGFGLAECSWHASAMYADPERDALYLVIDEASEPTNALLPVSPTPISPDGVTIYEFDADPSARMTYRWRSKLWLVPDPTAFIIGRVRAEDYTNLVARFIVRDENGTQTIYEKVIQNSREFRLPPVAADEYEVEFIGTSKVREFAVAQESPELP